MMNQTDIKEALIAAASRLEDLLPQVSAARKALNSIEMTRGELEDTIKSLQERLLVEYGEECTGVKDQLLSNFSLERHGKNFRLLMDPKHGQMFILGSCLVQCPGCGEYNIEIHYVRRRYADQDGVRAISKPVPQGGATRFRELFYCQTCSLQGASE
ncbi:MAG: hypothetical protein WCK39_00135 [Methanomassiliicoccales archaeon]